MVFRHYGFLYRRGIGDGFGRGYTGKPLDAGAEELEVGFAVDAVAIPVNCTFRQVIAQRVQSRLAGAQRILCGTLLSDIVEHQHDAKQVANLVPDGRRAVLDRYLTRSEERRVGKECRSRWSQYH